MSLAAPYQEHYYIADGEMVTFPFGDFFQALSQNYVKCVIYFSDGTSCVPTFTVNMENQQITIVTLTKPDGTVLTVPPAGSVVRVYRETPEQQNVTASQLQNYTAKQLEKIFDSMVAMQQETSYSDSHKNIRLTEPQRDVSIEALTEEKDQALLYWDEESRQIKATEYGQDEVINQIERANIVADEAKAIAGTARDDLQAHKQNKNNPHETSMAKLTDTEIVDPERFQFLSFDGTKWKNVNYSATYAWGGIGGNIADQTDLFDTFVKKTGDTVSGMYKHSYGSRTRYLSANNTNKYMDVFMNDDIFTLYYHYTNSSTATLSMRSYVDGHFNIYPNSDKGGTIGFPSRRFEKIYTTHLCGSTNGNNYLIVPDVGQPDTIATKSQVDLAANSGRMITDQGVWYAKMYAATVAPSAENGTNYADFSQVDGQGNPIIVIYERQSGAWVQSETITPPADYDGYVSITSKIWDITEQAGQQGGRILWNHQSKEFTPYPQIISFENAALTGTPTAPTLNASSPSDQIVNKQTLENAIGNGTITITQGGETKGTFTTNQGGNTTINLDAGGGAQAIDAKLHGSLTVLQNGDVSGTGFSERINIPGRISFDQNFEILLAFTTPQDYTAGEVSLFAADSVGWKPTNNKIIDCRIYKSNNQYFLRFRTPGTTTFLDGTTPLNNETKYYVKIVRSGNDYTVYLSTDGTTFSSEITVTSSESIVEIPYEISAFGLSSNNPTTIHLGECYIKLSNIIIWTGMSTPNLHQRAPAAHVVVEFQAPTAGNNYTWYRKYDDGWVEQGGHKTGSGSWGTATVEFPVTMANTYYSLNVKGDSPSTDFTNSNNAILRGTTRSAATSRTKTGFTCQSNNDISWFVCGMAE